VLAVEDAACGDAAQVAIDTQRSGLRGVGDPDT
jgi:hypothetical protein